MFRTLTAAAALLSLSVGAPAAPCRDAKGHFKKCAAPAATAAPVIKKGKDGKCRDAKGHFAKCPS